MKQNAIRALMAVAVEAIELAFDNPRLTPARRKQLGQFHVLMNNLLKQKGQL